MAAEAFWIIALTIRMWWGSHRRQRENDDVDAILSDVQQVYVYVTGREHVRPSTQAYLIMSFADGRVERIVDERTAELQQQIDLLTIERDEALHKLDQCKRFRMTG